MTGLDLTVASIETNRLNYFDAFKQNPKLMVITSVFFGALGIPLVTLSVLAASTSLAILLGASAAISFGISGALAVAVITKVKDLSKAELALIMSDTLNALKMGHYTSPDGTTHPLDTRSAASGASLHLSGGNVCQRAGNHRTLVSVKNKDCLYVAQELDAKGLRPIVLDMASDSHFGGGYLNGAKAQEEDCCRRSGLSLAVDTRHGLQTRNFYPLSAQSAAAGIYVPNVPVFRAGNDKGYQYLDRPFNVAFGVIAAAKSPPLDNSSGSPRLFPAEIHSTRQKIRTFFEMARLKGHESVVFGALGCGAFRNPPDHIAEIVMDVIDKEFKHCFKEIVIAVIDDQNAGHTHNPKGNFAPFARRALAAGGKVFDREDRELTAIP